MSNILFEIPHEDSSNLPHEVVYPISVACNRSIINFLLPHLTYWRLKSYQRDIYETYILPSQVIKSLIFGEVFTPCPKDIGPMPQQQTLFGLHIDLTSMST